MKTNRLNSAVLRDEVWLPLPGAILLSQTGMCTRSLLQWPCPLFGGECVTCGGQPPGVFHPKKAERARNDRGPGACRALKRKSGVEEQDSGTVYIFQTLF